MVQNDQSRGKRKQRTGSVISRAMQKTIVVKVERRVRHPFYGKEMTFAQKMYAHDEKDEAKMGDKVLIAETRPLSKLKRWRLVKVLQSGTYMREAKNEIRDALSPSRSAMAEHGHEKRDV